MTDAGKTGEFKKIGWYMITGWGRTRTTWKATMEKPSDMPAEEWDGIVGQILRDWEWMDHLESQEDWAYGTE